MRSLIATAIATVMFLSAGAVAGISHNKPAVRNPSVFNVTVIYKNSEAWPVFTTGVAIGS